MKNPYLLSASIVVAALIVAGAILYKPGAASAPAATVKAFSYIDLAGSLGMNTKAFKTCVDNRTYKSEVEKDQQDGIAAGVDGTPTTFINGQIITGAYPYATYKKAIDAALAAPADAKQLPGPTGSDKEDDVVLGDPNAKVSVIVFGDYQCPFCEQAYKTSEAQLRKEYVDTGKVNMVFRDFPLSNLHPAAIPAAEAAECAHAQGKYWEYHDALYENQDKL